MMQEEPKVTVGIVSAARLCFTLNGAYTIEEKVCEGRQEVELVDGAIQWQGKDYQELTFVPTTDHASFTLEDVTIGVNFHWERKEAQTFLGKLHFVVANDSICAINELPIETYLTSVISSEMNATSSLELLKAHAVISRSWLLTQIENRKAKVKATTASMCSCTKTETELTRWYDRDDHSLFDVCADDHCQRYQGITKATNIHVTEAIKQTRGEILMYNGTLCDARFSKCCGGVVEEFQYCWENIRKPYLTTLVDAPQDNAPSLDLTNEDNARQWIQTSEDVFCNTKEAKVLKQILNNYDQETQDFYRWTQIYTQDEICSLIEEKCGMKLGKIIDLVPLSRGKSGRIYRLKIVGSERSFIIGKELEIRRTLSKTHLYSSAFIVEKTNNEDGIPQLFTIKGKGWGHGVGLCQIGAAVMGERRYNYNEILQHYYRGAEIVKLHK